jgi:uncharacterized protein (DUF4415 family)
MKRKPNPELIDDENPEWTEEDFKRARRAREVLPEIFPPEVAAEMLKPRGRPKKASPEVVAYFKAQGRGWQRRMDEALKEWMAEHGEH